MWAAKNMRRNLGLSKRATCIFSLRIYKIFLTPASLECLSHIKTVMFVIENASVISGLKGFFDIL